MLKKFQLDTGTKHQIFIVHFAWDFDTSVSNLKAFLTFSEKNLLSAFIKKWDFGPHYQIFMNIYS